jgi:REP element-mobilizing transposase RayT
MANTYTQLYVQLVFTPKGREKMIPKEYKEDVHRYITGIVQDKSRKHKMLAINCMPDHIHIFVSLHPAQSISDLVNDIKTASTKFIKSHPWMPFAFEWQQGFGAFTYSQSQIDEVIKYVLNQEEHHKKKTFREEYLDFLRKFEIPFDEKYLFEFYD